MSDIRSQLQQSLGQAYTLERELGGGGMSRVFLATETRFARPVVVKLLAPELAADLNAERFEREVQLAAKLQHANIVPLLSAGESAGLPYYLMPFIEGESLRERIRGGLMPISEVISVLRDVARALAYAHGHGIVHRDIKPENVLLSGSAALVTDFGIAKAVLSAKTQIGTANLTVAGTNVGTPAYMAPEQAAGDEVDARSDVYAWGVMAYEMLAGRHPFFGRQSAQQYIRAHIVDTPSEVHQERPEATEALTTLVMRCLAKLPQDRPHNGSDLLRLLDGAAVIATPAQARRTEEPVPAMSASWRWRAISIVVFALALAALAVTLRGRISATGSLGALTIVPEKSIAVLPFVNISSEKEQEYFSDGLTEELINLLAKSTDMRVAARTSAFKFKGAKIDVKDVAQKLTVAYVLEGSVQKSGNTIRVTAQLIKAADGKSMWSDSYDRTLDDIFSVQDEIAEKAVKALQATLLANAYAANSKPRNSESYNLVLQGRHFLAERTQKSVIRAVENFQQALLKEPENAFAYAGLARAYRVQAGQGWLPVVDGFRSSRAAAERAVAIDPQLAEGHEALAYVQSVFDWDWAAAQRSYGKALELEPGNADVLRSAALLMVKLGRFDEAIVGLRMAIERDPLLSSAYSDLSFTLGATGDWAAAESAARSALELSPNGILRHFNIARALLFQGKAEAALQEVELEKGENWRLMGLAIVYHALGRHVESDRTLAEYNAKYASHAAMQIADVHAYRGDVNEAFRWLDRAYAQHDAGIADLKDDPWLKSLALDPRYAALLKKMKLPP